MVAAYKPPKETIRGLAVPEDTEHDWVPVSGFNIPGSEPAAPESGGQFTTGIKRGFAGTENLLFNAAPALAARGLGYDQFADERLRKYQQREEEIAQQYGQGMAIEQVEGLSTFGDWFAGTAGEMVGSSAISLLGGGVGAVGARTALKKGVEASIAKLVEQRAGAAVKKGAAERLARRGLTQATTTGAGVGAYTATVPITSGEAFIESGGTSPGAALLIGAVSAGLEIIPEMRVFNRLTGKVRRDASQSYLNFVTKEIAKTGAIEGLTEGAQESLLILQNMGLGKEPPENVASRLLNATLAGIAGGTLFGGVGGGVGGLRKPRTTYVKDGAKDLVGSALPEYDTSIEYRPDDITAAFGRAVPRDISEAFSPAAMARPSAAYPVSPPQLGGPPQRPALPAPAPQGALPDLRGPQQGYRDEYGRQTPAAFVGPYPKEAPLPEQPPGQPPRIGAVYPGLAGPPAPTSLMGQELARRRGLQPAAAAAAVPSAAAQPVPTQAAPPPSAAVPAAAAAPIPAITPTSKVPVDIPGLSRFAQTPEGRAAIAADYVKGATKRPLLEGFASQLGRLDDLDEIADALEGDGAPVKFAGQSLSEYLSKFAKPSEIRKVANSLRDTQAQIDAASTTPERRKAVKALKNMLQEPLQLDPTVRETVVGELGLLNTIQHAIEGHIAGLDLQISKMEEKDQPDSAGLMRRRGRLIAMQNSIAPLRDQINLARTSANKRRRKEQARQAIEALISALENTKIEGITAEGISDILNAPDVAAFKTAVDTMVESIPVPVHERMTTGVRMPSIAREQKYKTTTLEGELEALGEKERPYEPGPSEGFKMGSRYKGEKVKAVSKARAEKQAPAAPEPPLQTAMQAAVAKAKAKPTVEETVSKIEAIVAKAEKKAKKKEPAPKAEKVKAVSKAKKEAPKKEPPPKAERVKAKKEAPKKEPAPEAEKVKEVSKAKKEVPKKEVEAAAPVIPYYSPENFEQLESLLVKVVRQQISRADAAAQLGLPPQALDGVIDAWTRELVRQAEQAERLAKGAPDESRTRKPKAPEGRPAGPAQGAAGAAAPGPSAAEAGEVRRGAREQPQTEERRADTGPAGGAGPVGRPGIKVFDEDDLPGPTAFVGVDAFKNGTDTHQRLGINMILSAFTGNWPTGTKPPKAGFMLADGTGVGKTRQILAVAASMAKGVGGRNGGDVLVFVPNRTVLAGSYTDDAVAMGLHSGEKLNSGSVIQSGERGIYFYTYSDLSARKVPNREWKMVVFDEAHVLKNADTNRALAAMGITTEHSLFVTATPFDKFTGIEYFLPKLLNRSLDNVLLSLGLKRYPDPYKPGSFDYELLPGNDWYRVQQKVLAMRDQAVREGAYIRREYPFHGDIVVTRDVPLDDKQRAQQSRVAHYFDDKAENASKIQRGRIFGRKTQELRRWSEPQKIEHTFDRIQEELAKGRSVVVVGAGVNDTRIRTGDGKTRDASNSIAVPGALSKLSEMLTAKGIEHGTVFGDTDTVKISGVADFQAGKSRVVLMTAKSGGAGINLDDTTGNAPRTMLIMTPELGGDVFDQVLGRVSRRNTASPSQVEIILSPDSIGDTRSMQIVQEKMTNLQLIQKGELDEVMQRSIFAEEETVRGQVGPQDARKRSVRDEEAAKQPVPAAESIRATGVGPNIMVDPKRLGWFAVDGSLLKWKAKALHSLSTELNGGEKANTRIPGEKYPWPLFNVRHLDELNKFLERNNLPAIPAENVAPLVSPAAALQPADARKLQTIYAPEPVPPAESAKKPDARRPIQGTPSFARSGENMVWTDPDLPDYADELAAINEGLIPQQQLDIDWNPSDPYRVTISPKNFTGARWQHLVRMAKKAAELGKKSSLDMTPLDISSPDFSQVAADRGRRFLNALFADSNARTADQVLRAVGTFTRNPRYKLLAAALRKLGLDVQVVLSDDTPKTPGQLANIRFFREDGEYRTQLRLFRASLLDAGSGAAHAEETILHELVHAATYPVLENPNHPLRTRLVELVEAVAPYNQTLQTLLREDPVRALHEFIAVAFTNDQFRVQLSQLASPPKYRAKGFAKTLWDSFINWLRDLLGLKPFQRSVLDEVMSLQERMFTPQAEWGARMNMARAGAHMTAEPVDTLNFTNLDTLTRTAHTLIEKAGGEGISIGNAAKLAREKALGALTMRQMRDFYGDLFGGGKSDLLGRLIGQIQRRASRMQGIQMDSDAIDRVWRRWSEQAGKERAQEFYSLALDSTIFKMHPDLPIDHRLNRHLSEYGPAAEEKHAELAARFQALEAADPEAGALYRTLRDFNASLWTQLFDAVKGNLFKLAGLDPSLDLMDAVKAAQAAGDKPAAKRINAIRDFFTTMSRANLGPYFRLSRFGDWVIEHVEMDETRSMTEEEAEQLRRLYFIAKPGAEIQPVAGSQPSPEGKRPYTIRLRTVSFFETREQADAAADAYEKEFGARPTIRPKRDWKPETDQFSSSIMNRIFSTLGEEERMDDSVRATLKDSIYQIYIQALPETSGRKVLVHRKNIRGYNTDARLARRSFAQGALAMASHTAHAEHAMEIAELYREMATEIAGMKETDRSVRATAVLQEMQLRNSLDMVYSGDGVVTRAARFLSKLGFFWFLSSPSFWAMNMSQVPMVTYPALKSRFSESQVWNEISKAYKQVLQTDVLKGALSGAAWRSFVRGEANVANDLIASFQGQEKAMLDELAKLGLIDLTAAMELIQTAKGGETKISRAGEKAIRFAAHMPHRIEAINRVVTALATYRLALENKMTDEQAVTLAADIVAETQFDYTPANKARYMSDKFFGGARALFLFKQYAQHMTVNMIRFARQAVGGATKEERQQARTWLAYLFGSHALVAGVLGTPVGLMAQGVALGLQAAFGDEDEPPESGEVLVRNFLSDIFGTDMAEIVSRGAPRAVGVDLSRRMSINPSDLWQDFSRLAGIGEQRPTTAPLALQLLGVAGAPFAGIYEGAEHYKNGQTLRAAEAMAPKFLRDMVRAYRISSFGVEDRRGNLEIMPSQFGPLDVMAQALGVQPAIAAEYYEKKGALKTAEQALKDRREKLIRYYVDADTLEERAQAWEDIRRFSQANPALRITRDSLLRSKAHRMTRETYSTSTGEPYQNRRVRQAVEDVGRFAR